jgi:hypothetical protein
MRKVLKVTALRGYRLELEFDDGVHGTVDLADLAGKGVFALWSDRRAFEQVRRSTDAPGPPTEASR